MGHSCSRFSLSPNRDYQASPQVLNHTVETEVTETPNTPKTPKTPETPETPETSKASLNTEKENIPSPYPLPIPDIPCTPNNDIEHLVSLTSDIRALIKDLERQCKDDRLKGETLAREHSIYLRYLEDDEMIPTCPSSIKEMIIQDPNSASLKGTVEAFEYILENSPADVMNLRTTASLVCAQLSFVTYFDPHTKVERYIKIDRKKLKDVREIYNLFVAISLTKEDQSNEIIPLLLRKIIHIMKDKLPMSVPELLQVE